MESPEFTLNIDDDIANVPCEEVSCDLMKERLKTFKSDKSFSVVNFNIRSCRKNFPLFLAFLNQLLFSFSVICLTESWLSQDTDFDFNIDGYNQVNSYRNSRGGGIKVFYRDNYFIKILNDLTYVNNLMEVITFWLIDGSQRFLFSCIYRPPSSNANDFNASFSQYLSNLPLNSRIFILGDININLLNPYNHNYVNEYISILLS